MYYQTTKIAPMNLETPEDQIEKRSISPRQGGFNPHPVTGAHSTLYCSTAMVISGIPDYIPSGNLILLAPSVQGEVFIDKIMDDVKHIIMLTNSLSLQVIDHDMAVNVQRFLKDKDQK